MPDGFEVRVKKSHIAVLSVIILVASASAAVNVRDTVNVFGNLKITDGEISAEDQDQNPANVTFASPINMQGNNIYNAAGLGSGSNVSGGTPVFDSVSYTTMAETAKRRIDRSVPRGFGTPGCSQERRDYWDAEKTLEPGDQASVSKTAELGGTTQFRVYAVIVDDDDNTGICGVTGERIFTDNEFHAAAVGEAQILVNGNVVASNPVSSGYANNDRIIQEGKQLSGVVIEEPVTVGKGDTLTARVVATETAKTGDQGPTDNGQWIMYVRLDRADK